MFHELTPILSIATPIGTIEAWADRVKPIVIRNGEAITPLSIEQAQEVMRALGKAVKHLPGLNWPLLMQCCDQIITERAK